MASAQKGLMAMTGLSFIIGNERVIRESKDYPRRSYYCNLYLQYDFFERTGEMAFLDIEHLEGWAFADVIYILLIGYAVETHTTVVRDIVLLHNLIDALQHEDGLCVIGLH